MNASESSSVAYQQVSTSPWDLADVFPEKPPDHAYGFMAGKKLIGCSCEELIKRCSRDEVPPIHLVWTPDTPRLVPPAEVPFLLEGIKTRAEGRGKRMLIVGLLNLLLWGGAYWLTSCSAATLPPSTLRPPSGSSSTDFHRLNVLLLINAFFLGLLPLKNGIQLYRNSRLLSPQALAKDARTIRYSVWVSTRRKVWTLAIGGLFAIVGIAQVKAGLKQSIGAAGLVKDAVRQGEYIRLLTGTMLHGNMFHFWFNAMALLSLGTLVEALADRTFLMIVYLLSALAGSIASLLLLPNTTSVGASGALMGLIGFLVMLGYRRRANLPPGFLRSVLTSVFWIALLGAVAFDYIDNAAHAGGFICGLMMGVVLIGKHSSLPLVPTKTVRIAGVASALVLIATAGYCVTKILAK